MSTSYPQAWNVLRELAETVPLPKAWQFEDNSLPDNPETFVYFEMVTDGADFIEFGGGRGGNRYRHRGEFNAFVFVPIGWGMAEAMAKAETVAAVFRSYRDNGVSCNGAEIHPVGEGAALVPPGLSSVAGNYVCAAVSVPVTFEQAA